MTSSRKVWNRFGYSKKETKENLGGWNNLKKLQELFTDRVNNTLWATKKHFYDKFEVEQNLNRLDILKQFVKWLVDNDKIDFRKVIEKEIEIWFKLMRIKDYPKKIKEEDIEEVLMLLSIQDNPIEFLVSILK